MQSRHEIISVPKALLVGVLSGTISYAAWAGADFMNSAVLGIGGPGIAYGIALWLCVGRHVRNRRLIRISAMITLSTVGFLVSMSPPIGWLKKLSGPVLNNDIAPFPLAGGIGACVTFLGLWIALPFARSIGIHLLYVVVGAMSGLASLFSTSIELLLRGTKSHIRIGHFDLIQLVPYLAIFVVWQAITLGSLPLILRRRIRVWTQREYGFLCKSCDYNLTGNVSGVCPECGIEVDRTMPRAPQGDCGMDGIPT